MTKPEPEPAHTAPKAEATEAEHAASFIGQVIAGRYRIDSVLAMGGMGAVFRGEHVHMRKRVAIKVLHPNTQGLPEFVTRFERESVVGANAEHPNVASASDFGRLDDGTYYLVLEYIDGITLHELMKRGPVPVERAVHIARQLAQALAAIHKLDIFHRDIKPRNVMVVEGSPDVVKLIDFGFAKVPLERFAKTVAEAMSVTAKGTVFGTVGYMAPETAYGMHAVTDRSDLYALGVILYEMLAGVPPFGEKDAKKLFQLHQKAAPPLVSERAPDRAIPQALEDVTMRLLAKSPEDRYESAAAVIKALDEAMSSPASAGTTSSSAKRSQRPVPAPIESQTLFSQAASEPKTGRGLLIALVVLVLGAGGVLGASRSLRERAMQALGISEEPVTAAAASAAPASAPLSTAAPSAGAPEGLVKPASAGEPSKSSGTDAPASASSAPAAASVSIVDGFDAATWRRVLQEATAASDASRGAKALLALAQVEPAAFQDSRVIPAAAAVTVGIELGDRAVADSVYDFLSSDRIGSGGPDVLFHVTSFYGGSRGAKRAADLLRRPEVLARSTPALRVALDLRDAPCKEKPSLFERAARDGDDRTLSQLTKMQSPDCNPSSGICCMPFDPKIGPTITQIRSRIQK
jgi:serine/threonine-protein kinase